MEWDEAIEKKEVQIIWTNDESVQELAEIELKAQERIERNKLYE